MTSAEFVSERDTPSSYNLSYDDDNVPQRELTDFTVTCGDEKVSICSLDESKEAKGDVIARGMLFANSRSIKVVSAPLIEWCIEYSSQHPCLWVRSTDVWYRLLKPSKEYTKTHELARRRFELCSRIYILGTSMAPSVATYSLFSHLLAGPYMKMKAYSEKELLSEKDFILAQIKNLDDPELAEMAFVKELREKKVGPPRKGGPSLKKVPSGSGSNGSGTGAYAGQWVPRADFSPEVNARMLKRAEKGVSQLIKHKNGWPFHRPVDPQTDGCLDYLQTIEHPMDYGTIKEKLEKGKYATALNVAEDVRLVSFNCLKYNGKDHKFSKWVTELEQKFENAMRNGEEAELNGTNGAGKKGAANKKRKASDQLPPSGKGIGKKPAPKMARKNSKSSSVEVSPSRESSAKDDESSGRKLCARSTSPEGCSKSQMPKSKYCSDECGLIVARERIAELNKAGFSIEEYIKASLTKTLVHSRG